MEATAIGFAPSKDPRTLIGCPLSFLGLENVYWQVGAFSWSKTLRMSKQHEKGETQAERPAEMISLLRNYEGAYWGGI